MRGPRLSEADLLLFGHLQCLASSVGSTARVVDELRAGRWPRLLAYTRRLNGEFGASGYPWLYTAALDSSSPRPGASAPAVGAAGEPQYARERRAVRTASWPEQWCFWIGLWTCLVPLLPLTLLVLCHASLVRNVNPHASLKSYGHALLPWSVLRRRAVHQAARHVDRVRRTTAAAVELLDRPLKALRRPAGSGRQTDGQPASPSHQGRASPRSGNKRM